MAKTTKTTQRKTPKKATAEKVGSGKGLGGAGGYKSGGMQRGKKKAATINKSSARTKRKPQKPAIQAIKKSGASSNARAATHLNPRQLKFVQEYNLGGNATQAAVAAGYMERTAAQTASRLLGDKRIKKALAELQEEAKEEFKVTREALYEKLNQAFRLAAVCEAPAAMVSAVSTMARISGLDKPKAQEGDINITVNTGVPESENGDD